MINIQKIKTHHQNFLRKHDAMVANATNEGKIEEFVKKHITQHSGLKVKTGNLVNSTTAAVVRTRGGALISIRNKAKYAWAQDQGSGLYGRRRAKYRIQGNPYLRFMGKSGIVYRRFVMHPGVRPTRFLYNATDAAARLVASYLATQMHEVARKF